MQPEQKTNHNKAIEVIKKNQQILKAIVSEMAIGSISPVKKNLPTTPRSANTSFTTINNKIQLKNLPIYKALRLGIENMIEETIKITNFQSNLELIINLNQFFINEINSSLAKLDELAGVTNKKSIHEKQIVNHFNSIRKNLQKVKANCQNQLATKVIKKHHQKLIIVNKCIELTVHNNISANEPITIKQPASSALKLTDLEDFLKSIDYSANILFSKINQSIQQKILSSQSTQVQINKHNLTLKYLQQSIKMKQVQLKNKKTELQKTVSQKQQQIQNLKTAQILLNQSYTRIQQKYNKAIYYEKLSKKYETFETELSKNKDQLKIEKQRSEKISKQNQSLKKTIQQQKIDITKNINSLSEHLKQKQKLTKQILALSVQKNDLKAKNKQLTLRIEKFSLDLKAENEKEIDQYKKSIQKLERENGIHSNKIAQLIQKNQTLKTGIQQIRTNQNNLIAINRDLSNELQMMKIDFEIEREKMNDKSRQFRDEFDRKNDELDVKNKQLNNKISQLKTIQVEKQSLQIKTTHLQDEVHKMKSQMELLMQQCQKYVENERSAQKLKKDYEKSIVQIQQRLKKNESDLKDQSDLVKQLSLQLQKTKKQYLQQLQTKQKQLKDAQKKSQQNSLQVNKQLKQYKQAYQNLLKSQQPQTGQKSQNQLKNHINKQKQENSRKTSKFFSFFSTPKEQELQNQLDYLKDKTQEKSIQVNKLFKKQRESLQKQKRSLQEQLQNAKKKIKQLEYQLSNSRSNTT